MCALENMRLNCADAIDDCAKAHMTISMLEKELDQIKAAQDETKSIVENKCVLSQKIEMLMLQKTSDQLADDKHDVLLELESEKKKSKLINNRLNQDLSELRVKHQKEKTEIIKNLKSEIKSWRKDLGDERKEKIKLEKQLELLQKKVEVKLKTSTQTCQTDQHPDIPYSISDPLPPIFSSQLCHSSRRLGYLSRSLPNFNTVCWVKPDDTFQDEAEEALNEQYDRQIEEFYISEQERVKSLRDPTSNLGQFEGHIIINTLNSSRDSSITTIEEEEF